MFACLSRSSVCSTIRRSSSAGTEPRIWTKNNRHAIQLVWRLCLRAVDRDVTKRRTLPTCEQRSTSAQCAKPPRLNRDENLPADPIVFDDAAVLVLLLILSPAPRVMEGRVNDCCYAHHGQAE